MKITIELMDKLALAKRCIFFDDIEEICYNYFKDDTYMGSYYAKIIAKYFNERGIIATYQEFIMNEDVKNIIYELLSKYS